ncbi:hypothetical protein BD289DRAFT_453134 [Coniella lustricola]|uniref:HCP-like protein n=1 Tax=Coniella lustricola TaxID=2025994 RepID=A0A2T3A8H7_9PEZI|nr:hypothetical protein BD289DRAFT_453134 [Coniella lustricola]
MAYQGGYQGQLPPRVPPQRQYTGAPAPQQYNAQYDQYQGDQEYNQYGYELSGYDQGYGAPYDSASAQRGPPPPRDPYGPAPGRGGPPRGPPMNGGRGGPIARPPTADGQRRGQYASPAPGLGRLPNGGLGPGRGRPPFNAQANSDPLMNRPRPPLIETQKSPGESGFGDSPFPTFPGKQRKTNLDQEQQIISQMSGLDIDVKKPKGRAPARGRSIDDYGQRPSLDSQRGPPGPSRNYPPPQPPPEQRRGPSQQRPGFDNFSDQEFGTPARTRTMPTHMDGPPDVRMPQRADSAPYGNGGPRGMPLPTRSATAGVNRPPPQGQYPPDRGMQPVQESYGYETYDQGYYDNGYYNDFYDDGAANGYQQSGHPQHEPDMPNFDAAPGGRSSLDMSLRTGALRPQRGPVRVPELNKSRSQPDLRISQQTSYGMAADAPPMPAMPYQAPYGGAPPMSTRTPPVRPGHQPTPPNAEGISPHPAPVRPGHIQGALVNKPPPVRNYGGTPVPAAAAMIQPPAPTPSPMANGPVRTSNTPAQEGPVTSGELEQLRNRVKANSQDQQSAFRLAKRLIEAADVLVPNLPDPKARAKVRERYLLDAQKILKKLSNAGNPDAMFTLADAVGKGMFGEVDNKESFTLYQSAAKVGHPAAAYRTAVCCEIGNEEGGGTRRDPLKAMQWYKRAATLGDTPAMYKVGMILLKGLLGQQKNPREAISWLKRAAESADAENPHALHELGLLYESAGPNDVILRDSAYAFQLFKQGAELGYKFSQYRMGCAFEYGLMGCPVDPRLSIMWYSKAAEQGEHQSELALSGWYLTGSDNVLGQNDTEAYLWARKAAMAGLAKAEYAMGYFTEMGIGTAANMEDAKRWYWRAAAQDFPKARERLEELKRSGKNGGLRQRERIIRSKAVGQAEGDCSVM